MPALLRPLVDKLAQSESSPLIVQLLLVVAQLVHLDTNQLIDCLANQPAPGALLPLFPCSLLCFTAVHSAALELLLPSKTPQRQLNTAVLSVPTSSQLPEAFDNLRM